MSLEAAVKELNENVKKLIGVLEVYPSTLDEKTGIDKAPKKDKETPAEEAETASATHTIDELAALTKKVVAANKTVNRPKLKEKLDELGISKVTLTPEHQIDEMYEYLEGLG